MATTIYLEGGHIILIEKGFWRTRFYFDSQPMGYYGESKDTHHNVFYKYIALADEDSQKVTYMLNLIPGWAWLSNKYQVWKFDYNVLKVWDHDDTGELIYDSREDKYRVEV